MISELIKRGVFRSLRNDALILDLASGQNYAEMFDRFHATRASKYVAVDAIAEDDPLFSIGQPWCRYSEYVQDQERGECLSEEAFRSAFEFHWNTNALHFLSGFERKADCILLFNVLHLKSIKDGWRDWVRHSKAALAPGGLLCIEVIDESGDNLRDYGPPFSRQELDELAAMLPGVERSDGSMTGKTLLTYLHRKVESC